MSLHEIKKECKIVDELCLYLMKHGYMDLDISIRRADKLFLLTIKSPKCNSDIISAMDEYINREREIAIEEYGWELMGESDCQSDLEMIGLLIDKLEIDDSEDEYTKFIITRLNKY